MRKNILYATCYSLLILSFLSVSSAQKKPVTFSDIMKFEQVKKPTISVNGNWISYESVPDRGDSKAIFKEVNGDHEYKYERGSKPVISEDENWGFTLLLKDFATMESTKDKDKLRNDLLYLEFSTGKTDTLKEVKSFAVSKDSRWLAAIHYPASDTTDEKKTESLKSAGTQLSLIKLNNRSISTIDWVSSVSFDSLSKFMTYAVKDTSGEENSLVLFNLDEKESITLDKEENANYTNLSWNKNGKLAYLKSILDEDGKPGDADLYIWDNSLELITSSADSEDGWIIPAKNKLHWTKDGKRIFFGCKEKKEECVKDTSEKDIYNFDALLEKKELNVWHWKDPKIKTNEIIEWKDAKDKTYSAVYNLESEKITRLADLDVPDIRYSNNKNYLMGITEEPYLWSSTWDSEYFDNYIIDMRSGDKIKVAEKVRENGYLSPEGKYFVYYKDENWFLMSIEDESVINLTGDMDVQFSNEDHDYPIEADSYGFGGWIENDSHFFIYDKFDIWKFDARTGIGVNHTKGIGRENKLMFRIVQLDRNKECFGSEEELILTAYSDTEKYTAVFKTSVDEPGVSKILNGEKIYTFVAKAEKSDKYLFTRESFREYPDLWVSDASFSSPEKHSDLGSQFEDFKWGTPELIEWLSIDGTPIQGVVYKPDGFDPNKRYPVFIYYYRFSTPDMYVFPEIVINHRPKIPVFLGDDYVVFYPDIRFDVGRPGYSATKCLVPGVQKLIEMGIADPDAICLHGHSWSGYQTAFVVTQTDIFTCAVAGAPVSNMTSAYGGIRLGTGLARQFQYEKTQSRIGGSLFEYPERYIENSPLFFVDKINTPMLIQHGDIDEAVPWQQSIELYLGMRRLGKDCIFLQYLGEPHHLKKYPNRLDYTIKMKEYVDYHLKGTPAPEWISEGVPYQGKGE